MCKRTQNLHHQSWEHSSKDHSRSWNHSFSSSSSSLLSLSTPISLTSPSHKHMHQSNRTAHPLLQLLLPFLIFESPFSFLSKEWIKRFDFQYRIFGIRKKNRYIPKIRYTEKKIGIYRTFGTYRTFGIPKLRYIPIIPRYWMFHTFRFLVYTKNYIFLILLIAEYILILFYILRIFQIYIQS